MKLFPITIPGGSDTRFQYNNGGIFGGVISAVYNDVTGAITFQPNADSTTFLQVKNAAGDATLFNINTTNKQVTIDKAAAASPFLIGNGFGEYMKLYGTGSQFFIKWDDGSLHLQTDEGTNRTTEVIIEAKGTGTSRLVFERSGIIYMGTAAAEPFTAIREGGGMNFQMFTYGNSLTHQSTFTMQRARGTEGTPLASAENDRVGGLQFLGYDGTNFVSSCFIQAYVDGAVSLDSVPQRISFITGTNSTDRTEYLTIKSDGKIGVNEVGPETQFEMTGIAPYFTLHNSTHEDSDGGRESKLNFKGEQGVDPFEETTLARIEASHDGASEDDKGKLIFSVNDGDDGDSPTQALEIGSDLLATFGGDAYITGDLSVYDLVVRSGASIILAGATFTNEEIFTSVNTDFGVHLEDETTAFFGIYSHSGEAQTIANLVLEAGSCEDNSTLNIVKNSSLHPVSPYSSGIINEDGNFGTFVEHLQDIIWFHYTSLEKDEFGNILSLTGAVPLMKLNDDGLTLDIGILRTADIAGEYGVGVDTLSIIGGSKTTHYGGIGGGGGEISLQGGRGRDAANNPSSYAPIILQSISGKVGIGTSDPGRNVEIYGGNPVLRLRDSGATADATTAFIEFGGTDEGVWSRTGYMGDSSSANKSIAIRAEVGDLHLGDSSGSQVLVLQSGTVTIDGKLRVEGADVDQKIAEFVGDDASHNKICICGPIDADSQLGFMHGGSPVWSIGNNADNDAFTIRTGAGAFGTNDKFAILSNGNVGIAGAINSNTLTITSSSDTLDVSGVNTVFINISADIVLGGLVGGVDGQIVNFAIIGNFTNHCRFEHDENIGGATQDFINHTGGDEDIDNGGCIYVCNGTNWYDISHARHV